jgi:hypothetical protein
MSKVLRRRKLTSIHSIYQSPNIVSYFLFVSFLQSEKYIPSTCKTALDDIWAYLSILRAITAYAL